MNEHAKESEFIQFARQHAVSGSLREVFLNFLNPLHYYDNKYPLPVDNKECQNLIIATMNGYFKGQEEYKNRKKEIKKVSAGVKRMKLKNARTIIEEGNIHVSKRETYGQVCFWAAATNRKVCKRRLQKVEYILNISYAEIPIVGEETARLIHIYIQKELCDKGGTVTYYNPLTLPAEVPMRVETVN